VTVFRLLAVSLGVSALVSGLRSLGWLQTWEFQAFDRLVQLRPQEPPDDRLLVIAVEESDFQLPAQAERTGSLADTALAAVLDILEPAQPRLIGLDIYRDFPVRGDRADLATHLTTADHFFTICKGSDPATDYPGIAPPPEVPMERQGFSDVVIDGDGILRRHLLALNPDPDSPCATPYALSTQLALHYLAAAGIQAQFNEAGDLQLGEMTLPRLRSHPGPYARTDLWGYQLLLNYRAHHTPETSFPVVSLAAVLDGQLQPEDIRDRIVLIGVTAPSAEDFIATPYRTERGDRRTVPGVILQAQMVSQLLSAVQDGRPLLRLWPLWADLLWIISWAGLGAGLSVLGLWPRRWLLALVLATLLLTGCSFVLLLVGWWVPLVPAALALGLSSGGRWLLPDQAKCEKREAAPWDHNGG
jgi:CHASE2 domain-containing sensor protein